MPRDFEHKFLLDQESVFFCGIGCRKRLIGGKLYFQVLSGRIEFHRDSRSFFTMLRSERKEIGTITSEHSHTAALENFIKEVWLAASSVS